MVTLNDDDGVIAMTGLIERGEQAADLRIGGSWCRRDGWRTRFRHWSGLAEEFQTWLRRAP